MLKKVSLLFVVAILIVIIISGCSEKSVVEPDNSSINQQDEQTNFTEIPTKAPTPTPKATPTPEPTKTATPTPEPKQETTPTPEPTPVPTSSPATESFINENNTIKPNETNLPEPSPDPLSDNEIVTKEGTKLKEPEFNSLVNKDMILDENYEEMSKLWNSIEKSEKSHIYPELQIDYNYDDSIYVYVRKPGVYYYQVSTWVNKNRKLNDTEKYFIHEILKITSKCGDDLFDKYMEAYNTIFGSNTKNKWIEESENKWFNIGELQYKFVYDSNQNELSICYKHEPKGIPVKGVLLYYDLRDLWSQYPEEHIRTKGNSYFRYQSLNNFVNITVTRSYQDAYLITASMTNGAEDMNDSQWKIIREVIKATVDKKYADQLYQIFVKGYNGWFQHGDDSNEASILSRQWKNNNTSYYTDGVEKWKTLGNIEYKFELDRGVAIFYRIKK